MSDEVPIRRAPNLVPTCLRLERNGNAIKAKWGVPVDALWETNDRRWTTLDAYIYCNASKNMKKSGWTQSRDQGRHVTGDRIWVRDLGTSAHEHEQPYDRDAYHPKWYGRYLYNMSWDIWPYNRKGKVHAYATYTFQVPRAPTFEPPSYDSSTGYISCVMKTDAGTDAQERYDTVYRVLRQDNFRYRSPTTLVNWTATTETSFTIGDPSDPNTAIDIPDRASLGPGKWIKITFEAYARGLRGDSSTTSRSYTIAYPPVASITDIKVSTLGTGGIVTVLINTNHTANTPVDRVSLERVITTIPTVAGVEAATGLQWESVPGAEDNGNCQGLVDTVAAALPSDRNHYTYYRLVTEFGGISIVGGAVKAEALKRKALPTSDDQITIHSITSGEDGKSLELKLAWQNDDSNGTEVSWSENGDAWESTEQPNVYDVTWEDMENGEPASQVTGFAHSATLVIRGLETGKKYYVKARRFLDDESKKTYSDLYGLPTEDNYPIAPYVLPTNVVLEVPTYAKRGDDIEVVWRFDSEIPPTGWILYRILANDTKVVVDSGDDAYQAAIVKADIIEQMLADVNYSDDRITFLVSVTVGSDWVESEQSATVTIQDPPSLTVATSGTLMSQPMQFVARSSEANAYISYKIVSMGVSTQLPDSIVNQVEGDIVYSEKTIPTWYYTDGEYYATVTLPDSLEFYDGASYRIDAVLTSSVTGLSSDQKSFEFTVGWLHQARRPGYSSEIVPDLDTLSVTIRPDYPENYADTDLLDVYRLSPEGSVLVAESLQYGCEIVDYYAPFTKREESEYRLVTRTKDGDVQWTDLGYQMNGTSMRFDWGNSMSLELPYNIEMSNAYQKDFESRAHIDGSITGFWNEGTSRTATLKTKIIRIEDPETKAALSELARYAGPVFVRLPDGSAFAADVTVSGIDDNYNNPVSAVTLKASEIAMVDEYRIAPENVSYPDGFEPVVEEDYQRKQILMWSATAPQPADVYTLNEEPDGDISVKLTSSYDYYANPWTLTATRVGKVVTLGAFSSELVDYIEGAPTGTQFIVQAYYNI